MPKFLVFLILALPLIGAYAMYATGIVMIYQASRVINLAHGAMATVPAYVVYILVKTWKLPMIVAFPVGLVAGALIGMGIERVFIRRLRNVSSTAQTVGTVAAFGLLISLTAKLAGTSGLTAPGVFPDGDISVGSSILRYGQLGILGVAIVATLVLTLLFQRTWLGLAMRGAAVNRRAAALMGADPDLTSTVAWALGGAMAAMAGILLAAVTVLHPYSLSVSVLPAYVAALIGGMESLRGALAGSVIVGAVIGFVPILSGLPGFRLVLGQVGGPELTLTIAAMVVMAVRGQKFSGAQSGAVPAAPPQRRKKFVVPKWAMVVAVVWVWLPFVEFSIIGDANIALIYAIVAASLVLLTGWIGQISLAQAAFVGIGAFGSTQIGQRLGVGFPFTIPIAGVIAGGVAALLGVVALRVRGLYLAVATLIFAWMADQYLFSSPWLVGAGGSATTAPDPIGTKGGFPYFDLSDRRMFYVVALAMTALVLLTLSNIRRSKTGRAIFAIRGSESAAASFGVDVTRYKLMAFALSGFIAGIAGSLIVVSQETIVPAQFAFTWSLFYLSATVVGGLQSLGGAVGASVMFASLYEVFFRVEALKGWLDVVSASLLVIVLVFYPGGLARAPEAIGPAIARAKAFRRRVKARFGISGPPQRSGEVPGVVARTRARLATLTAQARREVADIFREIRSAATNVLDHAERVAPGRWAPRVRALRSQLRGVASEGRDISRATRSYVRRFFGRGSGDPTPAAYIAAPRDLEGPPDCLAPLMVLDVLPSLTSSNGQVKPPPVAVTQREHGALLAATDITVRFGGVTAVNSASLAVRPGEIVGLIGPNGAGKTTMFNAIAGLITPDQGRILHDGEDITALGVHQRAARGIGRTFQVIQLSPDLTVRENLMMATHVRNGSTFLSHLIVTDHSVGEEARAAERVRVVSELLGLTDLLDRPVGGLPFGTLRLIEAARALATGAPLMMLDEPASGLDETETARFAELLTFLRRSLGISLLLIEHDVKLVMSICDHVYVLDRGEPIADGPPRAVQSNPAVIASYLGGDAPVAATVAV